MRRADEGPRARGRRAGQRDPRGQRAQGGRLQVAPTDPGGFVERFTEWVGTRTDVVAAALVGSHAAGEARPDSDVDLLVVTDAPGPYLEDHSWVEAFGEVESVTLESWGAVTSLRVRYAGGPEVELGVATTAWASTDPTDPGTARVVRDGLSVLADPRGVLRELVARLA